MQKDWDHSKAHLDSTWCSHRLMTAAESLQGLCEDRP